VSQTIELGPAQGCVTFGERDGAPRLSKYELVGPPAAPVVLVQGGISSDAHVCASARDPRPGWWHELVGVERPLDTRRVRVLALDWLDDAETLDEQVAATVAVLDALSIESCAVLGASLGGSLALAFAAAHPLRVTSVCALAAAHRSSARALLWRALQREALALGAEANDRERGLRLARGLALSSYVGEEGLESGWSCRGHGVVAWADAHAAAWSRGPAAREWERLSRWLDRVDIDPARVRARVLLVGFEGDLLVPAGLQAELAAGLGGAVEPCRIATLYGHDAFLRDTQRLAPHIARWCEQVLA
jgi:homoserine O-acetyltransferase